jgi:hypothetical protein
VPFEYTERDVRFGVVCFAEISDELFSILALAGSDSCRILAVAVSVTQSALPVWQLLQAGASDALTWDKQGVAAKRISAKLMRWSKIEELVSEAVLATVFCRREPALVRPGAKGRGSGSLYVGADFADRGKRDRKRAFGKAGQHCDAGRR